MQLQTVLQAILLTADKPLSVEQLEGFFQPEEKITRQAVRAALQTLGKVCEGQSFELKETASGFRLQTRAEFQQWVQRHGEEKPPRYSRAFLEILALIAWRQPITRAEIEEIRGVAVNASIIKTLLEREWIKVVGYKEVPGRPEMLGTTRRFLDYFNLKSLGELPSLLDMKNLDIDQLSLELMG